MNTQIFRMTVLCHTPPWAIADWIRNGKLTQLKQLSSLSWDSGIETQLYVWDSDLNFFDGASLSVKRFNYRQTSEILGIQFQTTAIEQVSQQSEPHEFFGFPVHIKAMFTLYYSLLRG